MKHVIVAYDRFGWCAVPANNGGNGPGWQWGDEILIGFTQGAAFFGGAGHQLNTQAPQQSRLARSSDGGESWQTYAPERYQGDPGFRFDDAVALKEPLDFTHPGFVMRVEGHGYHGNAGQHWLYSLDKGLTWHGPHTFGALLAHAELEGRQFTSRTAYLVNGSADAMLFLSARKMGIAADTVSLSDKVFVARTTDGGRSFGLVAWIVSPTDQSRAVMPAPVRLSATTLVAAIRRRNNQSGTCWIDCFQSMDDGRNWVLRSTVGDTGSSATNGNPPAMIGLVDGRLCCVYGNRDRGLMLARFSDDAGRSWGKEIALRDDFKSVNGYMDLGYPRLFQRSDNRIIAVYFWCTPERPETHIEASIFDAP